MMPLRAVTNMPTATERDRKEAARRDTPVNAKCPTCDHVWAVCFLPMPLDLPAELMQRHAICPKGCTAPPHIHDP